QVRWTLSPLLHGALLALALCGVAVAVFRPAAVPRLGDLLWAEHGTATLDLVGGQVELLNSLAATGKPLVVVVMSSKPQVLPASAVDAAALVQAFSPGMRGGRAVAELLLGLIEPSGRLPISVPRHIGQQPSYYNQIRGQHGDRYADLTQDPLFAFGEGLGYTRVDYTDLRVHTPELGVADTVRATVTLTNVGHRPTRETVQVYLRDLVTSATWADKELTLHRQVDLRPGQSLDVDLELPAAACTIVAADGRRVVEPGAFDLLVGSSSRDRDLLAGRFTIRERPVPVG
ncbi:glycoside hydrolase family 3 C-terminal domain-containing protein, partial [Streptomyces hainanensis]